MNATITLDVAGTALTGTTFSIYQDVDLYTTPVATNLSTATLLSGYAATLNDNTNTVRILSEGACGNFKDIPVNRGDTSPSIVSQYTNTSFTETSVTSITGNGKSQIFISIGSTVLYSTDNGDTFTSESWQAGGTTLGTLAPSGSTSLRVLHDGTNLYLYWTTATILGGFDYEYTLHIYRVTNYTSGFASATYTEILSQTLGVNVVVYFMKYINNAYYLRMSEESSGKLLRTVDLSVDFSVVLSPTGAGSFTSIDNYGSTIFSTVYDVESVGGVYKSIDNGNNWVQVYSGTSIINIDVESSTRNTILRIGPGSNTFQYTTDGGTTYSNSAPSGLSTTTSVGHFIKKYKSVYLLENGTSTSRLYYVPNMYTATPLGAVQVGSDMTGTALSSLGQTADSVVLLQRNSLTLVNGGGIHSFLISDTI